MTTYRNTGNTNYDLGSKPPQIVWTVVRGDTSSFRVYATDDTKTPITVADWDLSMEIKRPTLAADKGIITDNASLIVELYPLVTASDGPGEFTVFLNSTNSNLLQTGDIFDIEITDGFRVWTVGQGSIVVVEDVTNSGANS
jgi:hypothetical protein